jgi:tetratricopeptide (TPR) repeat protein
MPRSISRIATLVFGLAVGASTLTIPNYALAQIPGQGDESRWTKNEYEAQLRLAQVYEDNRDYISAHRIYERLYQERPEVLETFEGYVRSLEALKKFAEAEAVLSKHIQKLDRSLAPDYYITLARMQAKQMKRSDALESFEKAEQAFGKSDDCATLLPIAFAMVDLGYRNESIEVIGRVLSLDKDGSFCAGQAATLYLRLAEYGKAAVQYLKLVERGESHLGFVQQRLAQFTQDSASRVEMLAAFKREVDLKSSSLPSLQLLAWMYGETKDYAGAYQVIEAIDNLNGEKKQNKGYELLMFADRARAEGALEIAVMAYDEALRRLKSGDAVKYNQPFIQQAELGAIKTKEAFIFSRPTLDREALKGVVKAYETYASSGVPREYAMEASNRAAKISLDDLFDLESARRNYYAAAGAVRNPTPRGREAMFGLVDVALASADLAAAKRQLDAIDQGLDKRTRSTDKGARDQVAYLRALVDFYSGNFDTSVAQLQSIMEDPTSDFANDAIALSNLIVESSTPAAKGALAIFAKGQLSEISHNYDQAMMHYENIIVTSPSSPLADDAILRSAETLLKLGKTVEAVEKLATVQEKMTTSPIVDQAQFRMIEIIERQIGDKPKAQRLYEDFLVRYPKSLHASDARERARTLRGDVF